MIDHRYRPLVGGVGGGGIEHYICQPGYIAGLIYGSQGPRYNGFPLYLRIEKCGSNGKIHLCKGRSK